MRVSVLIPVYNKAPYLRECLDSVYAQTFTDFEIVAVDDRSTDDSLAILEAETDPRLRIIALDRNRGAAGAANEGLDRCQGEYVVRMDADDIMVPDRIHKQVAFMDAHPDLGASSGGLQLFGASDQVWRFPLSDEACRAQLLFAAPLSQGASILRSAVVNGNAVRYGADWPKVGEDWLFWAMLMRVTRVGNLPDVLTLYRRGEQNVSHGLDKVETHREILRHLLPLFGIEPTSATIDTHLMAMTYFATPPDGAAVERLHRWLQQLLALNAREGLFPRNAFEARVRKAWDAVYHYLPEHGLAPALAHLRLSRRWPVDRLTYLAKVRLKTLLHGG